MNFKVGDRVRIVIADPRAVGYDINGTETVITGPQTGSSFGPYYRTAFTDASGRIGVLESCLSPLTDPHAEQFMERLKKLGKEPVPLTPDELEQVRSAG